MRLPPRLVIALMVAAATSCAPSPNPTAKPTPAPTPFACPAPRPNDPGYVSSDRNLVVNGSFGMPSISGRRAMSALPGWAVSGSVKLVSSPSCLPFPDSQYLSLAFGASISQEVPTTRGKTYLIQSSDSMEGICNIAGTELNTFWNSTIVSSSTSLATGTTPDAAVSAWGGYNTTGGTVTGTGTPDLLRFVATNVAYSCALDISNVSVEVASPATPAP